MALAKKAFSSLQKQLKEKGVDDDTYKKLHDNLSIAALLHDIGHAPYSHLGEKYYRRNEIIDKLNRAIDHRKINIDKSIFSKNGSKHELMSCYILLMKYYELLLENFKDLLVIELIFRCIIGATYPNKSERWLENICIQILNSGTIDTDKLDYIMRDSYMTGISVPTIDTARLFYNIKINPKDNNVTFEDRALHVIQNIIDTRDFLYLWVYNHHTVVYTDFLIEFYIKHLIANFEKNKFIDNMDPNDYFSCEAICNRLSSDSDLFAKLKEPILKIDYIEVSKYTKNILPQLYQRKFLKPIWKTLYEYNNYLKYEIKDEQLIELLQERMCDEDYCYRRYVVKEIIKRLNLNLGDVFIVPRSNKFYSLNVKNTFWIQCQGNNMKIDSLLPQRDFKRYYNDVAFYVYGKKEKIEEIKKCFFDIVKEGLPNKENLPDDATVIDWFNYK
jgi:HD superfamily phosphohydrolase